MSPEEIKAILDEFFPYIGAKDRRNEATGKLYNLFEARLAKAKQGYEPLISELSDKLAELEKKLNDREVDLTEAKREERERIADKAKFTIHTSGGAVIIDRDDWARFWQALKGEPTIKPLQVLVNGEWREASEELKATADSIEQALKEAPKSEPNP